MGGPPPSPLICYTGQVNRSDPMTEAYAIFTTGNDYYDRPELFGLYATAEKAEADAAGLRKRMDDYNTDEPLYVEVSVAYVPIRY